MVEAINCNFARTAVRSIAQSIRVVSNHFLKNLWHSYTIIRLNTHQQDKVKYSTIKKLLALFNEPWKHSQQKEQFLNTFSSSQWNKLPPIKKALHSVQQCQSCQNDHTISLPCLQHHLHVPQNMSIEILPDDLTSSATLGQSVLSQLDTIAQQHLGKTAVEVLTSTPKAKLVVNPGRTEQQKT